MQGLVTGLETYLGASLLFSGALSFAGGFLASLSPCVYPLLPIVATYVGSRSIGEDTRLKAFFLSLSYVLGMALVYSCLGIVAALTGSFFGNISTNPWSQFVVANIIILFGLNILDVIPFPSFSIHNSQGKTKQGMLGSFIIGAVSGLVASPCTIPILGVILTYVATTQNYVRGGILLFSFSLGMGVILILVGTFSGLLTSIPKPGNWMHRIRKFLGLAMIGLGEYFLINAGQLMF